jgi:spermidine synthase
MTGSAPRWIDETLYPDWGQRLTAASILFEDKTEHQHLVIFENERLGRVMLLDGVVQVTTADEFIYHEMMAHVPLVALGDRAKRVLVVGGGDGGILREVLKHRGVEKAVLCEIDRSVIDLCQQWFPDVSAGALTDERVEIVIADAAKLVAETDQWFDAILVDSTDPHGPGAVLFSAGFYADCKRCLNPGGVLVTQNGVPFMQPAELQQSVNFFRGLFADAGCYLATVPTYVGGPMAFGWASDDASLRHIKLDELAHRFTADALLTRQYSPAVHHAAFALPPYIAGLLAG